MSEYNNYPPFCKDAYVGAPVKAHAHACQYCGHKGHGHNHGCPLVHGGGLCAAVVDDANGMVYLYGNVMHENYHVAGSNCVASVAVQGAGFEGSGRGFADEFWEGVQDGNNIKLNHVPIVDDRFMVFLNGLKQRQGAEQDFILQNGNQVHFNFYDLLPTDRVEVVYEYRLGE